MRSAAAVAVLALALTSISAAVSQEVTIVDACVAATKLQFGVETVYPEKVQAFPELSPPRVQFEAMGSGGTPPAVSIFDALEPKTDPFPMGGVRCEFERAARPFGLTAFECSAMSCFVGDERLEELQVLLTREGL